MNKYKNRFFGQDKFREENKNVLTNINLTKAFLTLGDIDDKTLQNWRLIVPESIMAEIQMAQKGESLRYFRRKMKQEEFRISI